MVWDCKRLRHRLESENNRVSTFWKFTWEGIQRKQKSD